MEEIKNCPFCGYMATLRFTKKPFGNYAYVKCGYCDASTKQIPGLHWEKGAEEHDEFWFQKPFEMAIVAWNKRVAEGP